LRTTNGAALTAHKRVNLSTLISRQSPVLLQLGTPSEEFGLSVEVMANQEILERHIKPCQQPVDMCQRAGALTQQ
jgi:hypothetical protein